MSETRLVKEIMLYLQQRRDLMCWRNNVGGQQMANRFVKFGNKGHADIFGIMKGGKFFCVEAKYGRNTQTAEQKLFQQQVQDMEAIYILAYGLEDVISELPEYSLPIVTSFIV